MICFALFECNFPKPEVPPIIQNAVGLWEKRWINDNFAKLVALKGAHSHFLLMKCFTHRNKDHLEEM